MQNNLHSGDQQVVASNVLHTMTSMMSEEVPGEHPTHYKVDMLMQSSTVQCHLEESIQSELSKGILCLFMGKTPSSQHRKRISSF
jgi:hypothetical protein